MTSTSISRQESGSEDQPQEPDDGGAGPREPLSWPARALALGGWGVVVIGVLGVLARISHFAFSVPWREVAEWFIFSTLFHDLIVAPVVTVAALGVGRLRPRLARAPVAVGLIVSGSLVAVSYPRLRGYGESAANPSILPGNAARDLAVVLAVVWAAVIASVVYRLVKDRSVTT